MNNILIIGAGRSATSLIRYALNAAEEHGWFVTVADADPDLAASKVSGHERGRAVWLDATKVNDRRELIGRSDVIVSLLPAFLHLEVAHDCIRLRKHLITASYLSHELYKLGDLAKSRQLIFMGEMGLDPGIDHMSAMRTIHRIQRDGGNITSFRSYTGGLVSPESDTNPWHYKISWNPRNVVTAGQGTAQYLEKGRLKFIPYNRLFSTYKTIQVPQMGEYEVYPNRDSLLYKEVYGLADIPNILRGTIRHSGYCEAWDALVKIGLTDGSYPIVGSEELTYHDFLEGYVPDHVPGDSLKARIAYMLQRDPEDEVMSKLDWLGLFSRKRLRLKNASPAYILEQLLLEKWKLKEAEKDMVIMQHEFDYTVNGKSKSLVSSLVLHGEDHIHTAMAKTVGLPLGIFVKLVMLGKIQATGVNIPVMEEVYEPVLQELEQFGVVFHEHEIQ